MDLSGNENHAFQEDLLASPIPKFDQLSFLDLTKVIS